MTAGPFRRTRTSVTRAQGAGYTVSDGTFYNPFGPGQEPGQEQKIACKQTGDSTSIAINNHATGIGNGSGNANSFGGAASLTKLENNTFNGDFNASGNGNGAAAFDSDDAGAIGSKAIIENNFMAGDGNGSGNGNGAVIADGGNCNSVYVQDQSEGAQPGDGTYVGVGCFHGGTGEAIVKNNNFLGAGNAAANGNGYNGKAVIVDNSSLGTANLADNGNGDPAAGDGAGDGKAIVKDNFVVGGYSGSDNGNSTGGGSGEAIVKENTIIGVYSGSGNGNNTNGSAHVIHNTILGSGSGSWNADHVEGNTILGDYSGSWNGDYFVDNKIIGTGSGDNAGTNVHNNTVIGDNSGDGYANNANNNFVAGNGSGNGVDGANNIAIGNNAGNSVVASNTIAVGTNAQANGEFGVAIGYNAFAAGPNDTALGAGATVTADHSTALGAGATATRPNEFVMGTTSDTYKAPGITSQKSKNRQSGPLEVVTSDSNGHLATDGGAIFGQLDKLNQQTNDLYRRTGKNEAGVALALAAINPDLTGNEQFGMTANWGNFEGSNAFGMGFEGVLGHDVLTRGDRLAVTGGWGVGFDGSDNVFGGRLGGQWTWGGAPR